MPERTEGGKSGNRPERRRVRGYTLDEIRRILEGMERLEAAITKGLPIHQTHMTFEAGSNPTIIVSKDTGMTKFEANVGGNVGSMAQGDRAQATNLGAIGQALPTEMPAYMASLAIALQELLRAMQEQKTEPDHEADVMIVKAAEEAARAGDPSKTVAFLKRTGSWAFEVATKIGASVAVDAIKHAAGIK